MPIRPVLLPLLALLCAVTACQMPVTQKGAVGQQEAILATATISGGQAQNGAKLMGENRPAATPALTALPTADPIIAQMAQDVKAANDRADAALKQVNDQNERIAQDYANAAADNEKTARHNEAIAATDLQNQKEITAQQREITQQKIHDNRRLELETAAKEADVRMLGTLFFCVLIVSMVLLALRALARYPLKIPAPVTVSSGDYFMRPWVPTAPTSHVTKPLPVSEEIMYIFVEYAVQGLPLGENSMVKNSEWKSGEEWRKMRQAIMVYLDEDCHHIKDHKLTPEGIDFWNDWIDEHIQFASPIPAPTIAETDAPKGHEHVNNDNVSLGEVVVDDTDPATRAQFTPSGDTLNAGLDATDKDETK